MRFHHPIANSGDAGEHLETVVGSNMAQGRPGKSQVRITKHVTPPPLREPLALKAPNSKHQAPSDKHSAPCVCVRAKSATADCQSAIQQTKLSALRPCGRLRFKGSMRECFGEIFPHFASPTPQNAARGPCGRPPRSRRRDKSYVNKLTHSKPRAVSRCTPARAF